VSSSNAFDRLAAVQAGNSAELEILLAEHRPIVYRYGLRYCRTSEDAEDAVQETLWAAARSIKQFRRAALLTTWLFTIVRNKCHRSNRKIKDPDLADLLPFLPDDSDPLEQQVAQRQIERRIARALSMLAPIYREVIVLRDVQGLTAPEAAQRLSISVHALKSRLHRARAELRNHLQDIASD
jgi:RNA polymerase sigma-70 factor (ECF subfamily)